MRLKAVEVLARMGPDAREAVPDLVTLLDDPDDRIRKATTHARPHRPRRRPRRSRPDGPLLQAEPSPPVELQPVPME